MSLTVALVGRPNVGKSTLFNRLVGRKLALVDDQPGVTRDLREGAARLGPLRFTVIDTAGLEEATDDKEPPKEPESEPAVAPQQIDTCDNETSEESTATPSTEAEAIPDVTNEETTQETIMNGSAAAPEEAPVAESAAPKEAPAADDAPGDPDDT